jgi:arginine decarboxylase
VLVDRNCHKSVLHAIMMTGTVPIFLQPTRNQLGIIGPIPKHEFSPDSIRRKIEANPLVKDKSARPQVMTITQSTYDGVLYNVETIKESLGDFVENLHFDEAWLPHATFHPLYHEMHAIGENRPRSKSTMVFSTQSTHKLLAGLSQASQILVQEPLDHKLDTYRFNESYLMHTSTSPQYAIIASCDVAAAMMEQPGGRALVEESISEALDFRRAMRKVDDEFGDSWWFRVWGPKSFEHVGAGRREDWILKPTDAWHGFDGVETGFNMLDPIKATLITPGLGMDGGFSSWGIPASLVTKYLSEHGVVVEKTGLYSFFVMFTIGITKGRWNTLVTELQQFKADYDSNQPLWRVMPDFVAKFPAYERVGLRDLAQQIHEEYRRHDVARVTMDMYLSVMEPAMKPSDAFECLAHRKVDRVQIDELEGRITTMLVTPYPPGIPLLIPGERFNRTIVEYLKFVRTFNERFPGFSTDVHGLAVETKNGVSSYFVDCVRT